MKYTALLLSFFFLIACCKEDEEDKEVFSPSTSQEIQECHKMNAFDSIQLETKLVGTWRWQQQWNPWTNEIDDEAFEDVLLTFKSGGVVVRDDGNFVETGEWSFQQNWCGDYLNIELTSASASACFYLCEDEFILVNSFVDGLDVWYAKD